MVPALFVVQLYSMVMMIKRGNTIDVTAKKCAKNECHSKAALSGVATKAD